MPIAPFLQNLLKFSSFFSKKQLHLVESESIIVS